MIRYQRQRFKVFIGSGTANLEEQLNAWADTLPPLGVRIRRTQLAVTPHQNPEAPDYLYALVNYEEPALAEVSPLPKVPPTEPDR